MNKQYTGFIAPEITRDNFVFGSVGIPLPVIKEDGDWSKHLPQEEQQHYTGFDTYGCTVYATTNAIETLENFLYGIKSNHSDRYVYNDVGIEPPGSDPHLVATHIRGAGLIDQQELPNETANFEEYKTPRPLPVSLRIKGQQWLNKQMLGHQWLWTSKPDNDTRLKLLKEALTKGTVCVSVSAWYQDDKGLFYSPKGSLNGHWTFIYKIDDTGIYVFDSYRDAKTGTFLKKLTLDHDIQYAKVYYFTKPDKTQNWLIDLIKSFMSLVGLLEKKVEVIKKVDNPTEVKLDEVYNEVKETLMEKYDWSTQEKARHSVRVICDEERLSVQDKNDLCATVGGESAWLPRATGKPNKDGTRDYGIAQLNSKYWIGEGKLYPNIEAVYNDPEGCIRWMCKQWKAGNKNWWYAFKKKSYLKYMNPKFDSKGKLI